MKIEIGHKRNEKIVNGTLAASIDHGDLSIRASTYAQEKLLVPDNSIPGLMQQLIDLPARRKAAEFYKSDDFNSYDFLEKRAKGQSLVVFRKW